MLSIEIIWIGEVFAMSQHHNMGSTDKRRRKASLLKKYGNRCFYCKESVRKDLLSLDHRIPRSQGGDNSLRNLVLACVNCNERKADDDTYDWRY